MRNKTYPLFTLFLFLSGLLFAQNSTQLTTDRLKFNEVGVEKAYIDWTGSDLFLINQELGDSDILMRAHNDLFFQTDALTRMTILKNGHVGIGLFDPIYPFQVDFSGQTGMLLRGDNTGDAQLRIENGGGNIHLLFDDFSEGNSLGIESSNEMLFNTNGANERMRIAADGKVGIGTNTPLSPFHIEFTGAQGLRIRGDNTGDSRLLIQNIGGGNHFIFDDISDANALDLQSSGEMTFLTNGANEQMRISSTGNVGIGTTAPEKRLHVFQGSAGIVTADLNSIAVFEKDGMGFLQILTPAESSRGILFGEPGSISAGGIIYNGINASDGLDFRTNGNDSKMVITDSGNVGIGTNTPLSPLHIEFTGAKGLRIRGDNTGDSRLLIQNIGGGNHFIFDDISESNALGVESSGEMIFNTNGANERMRIDADGKVGIGTGNPGSILHIEGSTPTLKILDPNLNVEQKSIFRIGKTESNNESIGIEFKYLTPLSAASFHMWGDNFGDALTIQKGGYVGIGTDNPTHTLSVVHDNGFPTASGGNGLSIKNSAGNDWALYTRSTNDQLAFMYNGVVCAYMDHSVQDIVAASDRSLKSNITTLDNNQLEKVLKLNPVTYHFKQNKDKKEVIGFIAQEVQPLFPEVVSEISNTKEGEADLLGVAYSRFTPILVAAIQEQQTQIEDLQETNEKLQTTNEELMQRLARIEALLGAAPTENRTESIQLTNAELKQNAPNPFTENTQIRFFIPESVKTASLQITDLNGKVLKNILLQARGGGQIELQAHALSAGNYIYSLILDGAVLETKQMIITKN